MFRNRRHNKLLPVFPRRGATPPIGETLEDKKVTSEVSETQQQEIEDKGKTQIIMQAELAGAAWEYSQPSSTVSATSLKFVTSSNTNEWYTEIRYIDLIREALEGYIQLDPASCEKANRVVGAERYYTLKDNGLLQPWNASTMFVNPPYAKVKGQSEAGVWLRKLISEYKSGTVKEAILLIYASTSEKWFQPAYDYPICFTNHRMPFWGRKGKSPTKGNAIVYFGHNPERFARVFEGNNIGTVMVRYRPLTCIGEMGANSEECSTAQLEEFPTGEEAADSE
jgi:hypothetical protein